MKTPEHEELTFSREEFYEKVWSAPATRIAKELGCSDVMVGKVCKAFDIPKPYLGYWAKLEHGKKPKRTPLPRNTDPEKQSLTFFKHPELETSIDEPEPEPVFDPDIEELLERARQLKPLTVPKSLNQPHPLVAATRDGIRARDRPYCEQSFEERNHRRPTLDISVSKWATTRALCIMDALIKRVEKIGGTVEIKKDGWQEWRNRTTVVFGGDDVQSLRLREKQKQVRIPPEKRDRWGSSLERQPTGMLILDSGPSSLNSILLRDTPKRRRIEDGLNDLIIGFVKAAGLHRISRQRAEEERAQWEAEERIRRQREEELDRQRQELERRQRAEHDRVDQLVQHANAWHQAQVIRDYLDAARRRVADRAGEADEATEPAQYVKWASEQADRIDPLTPSPPSILDEHI